MRISPSDTIPAEAFRRYDESPDELFYQSPRFVTHIDDGAIAAVTRLYREFFPADGVILDLMSSWISHLPPEVTYRDVVGLGMNRDELAANPRLTEYMVHNLNENPTLPFASDRFDGAGICVSVDYLADPVAVLCEVGRVTKPGAPIVITFSNRCFPTKVIAAWHALDDAGRQQLVAHFLQQAGNWDNIQTLNRSPVDARGQRTGDPLFAVIGYSH